MSPLFAFLAGFVIGLVVAAGALSGAVVLVRRIAAPPAFRPAVLPIGAGGVPRTVATPFPSPEAYAEAPNNLTHPPPQPVPLRRPFMSEWLQSLRKAETLRALELSQKKETEKPS